MEEKKRDLLYFRRANEYYSEITRSCLGVISLVFWFDPALAHLQNARKVGSINPPPGTPMHASRNAWKVNEIVAVFCRGK